jgi:tetratricopeptide (TPR) repeat protein
MMRSFLVGLAMAGLGLVGGLGAEELDAPISMADPNGQDLVLEDLDVRVAVHGPLALTELEMRFRNPQNRQVEGRFACNLPAGATISRFAKEVGGKFMEGEVVERLKAKRVYTEILHTMRDPALLEQDQGNRFQARIFPIPARSQVRLLLSYSKVYPVAADGTRSLTVPLRGLQKIGRFGFRGVVRTLPGEIVTAAGWLGSAKRKKVGAEIIFSDQASWKNFTPDQDLTLVFAPSENAPRENLVRAGDFRMVTYRPRLPGKSGVENPDEWVFYVDTSASAAPSASTRLKALRAVFEDLGKAQPGVLVKVFAFDLGVVPVGKFRAGRGGLDEIMNKVAGRHFLGATDLEKVVEHLGNQSRKGNKARHFVLVSDVVPSLAERDAADLASKLGNWPVGSHLHVLQVGSLIEEKVSRALAEYGRGRVVPLPLTATFQEKAKLAVASLRRKVGVSFQVRAPGAEWVQPDFFEDVQDGVELVAFVKGGSSQIRFDQLGGATHKIAASAVKVAGFAPLLERLAYKSYLTHLDRLRGKTQDVKERKRLQKEQLEISLKHRVLCSLTSMLVLESERDYRRFEIDRRALVDIMEVGEKGIELRKRAKKKPASVPKPKPVLTRDFRKKDKNKSLGNVFAKKARIQNRAISRMEDVGFAAAQEEDTFSTDAEMDESAPEMLRTRAASAPRREQSARHDNLRSLRRPRAPARPSASRGAPGRGGEMGQAFAQEEAFDADESVGTLSAPEPLEGAEVDSVEALESLSDGAVNNFSGSPPRQAPGRRRMPAQIRRRVSGFASPSVVGSPPPPPNRPHMKKRPAPSWVQQATWRPGKALLKKLRAKVAKNPRDRKFRNSLGWALMKGGQYEALRDFALGWQPFDPRNPMVYEYLGVAYDSLGEDEQALRAFSTIAEISPGDSGLLNRAGYLAFRAEEYEMAATLFRFAIEHRPEHQNNYRGLALTLWAEGKYQEAVETYQKALKQNYHGRYKNVKRILREEARTILNAWQKADKKSASKVKKWASKLGVKLVPDESLRITLHWETDANDVDLHVVDPNGEESFYSHRQTASGVHLYEDLTQGLGPECTVVPRERRLDGSYHVGVKYFAAGPMGVSRGIVVIHRPSQDGSPDVSIFPFTLLPDLEGRKQDMRHVALEE